MKTAPDDHSPITDVIPVVDGGRRPPHYPNTPRRGDRAFIRNGALAVGALAVAVGAGAIGATVATEATQPISAAAAPSPLSSTQSDVKPPAGSVEQVAADVMPSVVQLKIDVGGSGAEGSGVVLSQDGLILTNNHVVAAGSDAAAGTAPASLSGAGTSRSVTFADGRTAPFTVVGTDPAGDLAVVRAEGVSGLKPIAIGSSKDVRVGEKVVAIGSPLGLQGTVTTGIVSALNRPVAAGGGDGSGGSVLNAIQTDAAINPGNSGGALVNMKGELIGLNSAIASMGAGSPDSVGGQRGSIGLGFAIPSDEAKRIADELVSTGSASRGSLGVRLNAGGSTDPMSNGVAIADVTADGPAASAGIPSGAVITKVDDQTIDGPEALVAAVRSKAPGEKVTVTYLDGSGASRTAEVTLGKA